YFPLDSDRQEIRLLEIQSGQLDDPLVCSLVYASISDPDNVPYSTLSYCWGIRKEVATMALSIAMRSPLLQGPTQLLQIQVQANLHNALRYLRHERGGPRVVWADAVCINQQGIEERNQQVAMMRDIYVCAKDVRIWLGEGDGKTPPM
ncbi:hypothetical protein K402DRAFT_307372, partial [Aulographum hederae CBS 113979]